MAELAVRYWAKLMPDPRVQRCPCALPLALPHRRAGVFSPRSLGWEVLRQVQGLFKGCGESLPASPPPSLPSSTITPLFSFLLSSSGAAHALGPLLHGQEAFWGNWDGYVWQVSELRSES